MAVYALLPTFPKHTLTLGKNEYNLTLIFLKIELANLYCQYIMFRHFILSSGNLA